MASGIVGTLAVSSSLTYTPSANAKVKIAAAATTTSYGSVTVNGVAIISSLYQGTATQSNALAEIYVAAGVAVTIATSSTATAVVSSLEAA